MTEECSSKPMSCEEILKQALQSLSNSKKRCRELEEEVQQALTCATKSGELHGEVLDKIRLAEDFGMKFGVLKSSDCKEGKMAFDVKEGSDLWRLEQELTKRIVLEVEVEKLKEKKDG